MGTNNDPAPDVSYPDTSLYAIRSSGQGVVPKIARRLQGEDDWWTALSEDYKRPDNRGSG